MPSQQTSMSLAYIRIACKHTLLNFFIHKNIEEAEFYVEFLQKSNHLPAKSWKTSSLVH